MPIKPDHRAQMLQFFAKDCTVEDLKGIRSDIEAELSRRISAKLVQLTPGDRVRFLLSYKRGELIEEVGTLIRIHRRSMIVELMNREEVSVPGDRFIEVVPEAIYQDLRNRRNLRNEPDTSHVTPAVEALERAREEQLQLDEASMQELAARGGAAQLNKPPLDPRSVQLPEEIV